MTAGLASCWKETPIVLVSEHVLQLIIMQYITVIAQPKELKHCVDRGPIGVMQTQTIRTCIIISMVSALLLSNHWILRQLA